MSLVFSLDPQEAFLYNPSQKKQGLINREENKSYVLGARVLSLGYSFLNSSNLATMSKPYLDELSSEVNKTVNLAILDNVETLFLYRKEVRRFMKPDLAPGSKLPVYAGALDKILLAGLGDKELENRLGQMKLHPITAKTITSKKGLWEEIKKTRKRGYSVCDQELSMDLYSIAVPLINGQGEVVAAINVSMEASYKASADIEKIIWKLTKTGQMVSSILGYQGPYPSFST